CPEAISAADQGSMVVNYRNEPVPFRVRNPNTNTQASGAPGDLSKVYKSHIMNISGHKWLHEPGTPQDPLAVNNSGFRNSQMAGISEHFEFITGKESIMGNRPFIDYLYQNSDSVDGQWNGMWGLLRVYNGRAGLQTDLLALPNNTAGAAPLSTNDSAFPIDSTFPTGATDFLDSSDPSVLTYSTATTDTSLMSGTMLGTDSTST